MNDQPLEDASSTFTFEAATELDTERFGAALAESLPEQVVVVLSGTLGAGKTRLVQAVARACHVPAGVVTSPTFVLCQEYHGDRDLFHLDVYRLRDADEFLDLGPEEYFQSPGITFIEWGDRVEGCLPDHVRVGIDITGPQSRRFTVSVTSEELGEVISRLATALKT